MERNSKGAKPSQLELFALPPVHGKTQTFGRLRHPIWTQHKARLIARYLYYFVLITKHGAYIDGFAGPQEPSKPEMWAARLVLETEPRWLRNFFLCDANQVQFERLEALKAAQPNEPGRSVELFRGDFNSLAPEILKSPLLGERVATFCLLDQRAFECNWNTARLVAQHKTSNKVEIFYFVPSGWLHRSLSGLRDSSIAEIWWGRSDWEILKNMSRDECATQFCRRFKDELGYSHVYAWPIYENREGSQVMYHMVHATDHPEAPNLMARAYRKATGAAEPLEQLQLELEQWRASRS